MTVEAIMEEVTDWWGVIKSTGSGVQFDDYFERQDLGQSISFGIDSRDPDVQSQIEALRDTGRIRQDVAAEGAHRPSGDVLGRTGHLSGQRFAAPGATRSSCHRGAVR